MSDAMLDTEKPDIEKRDIEKRDTEKRDIESRKQQLRNRFADYRRSLSDAGYRAAGRAVSDLFMGMDVVRSARTIHVYWPIERVGELDTRPLIDQLRRSEKRIVLPVVDKFERFGKSDTRMSHRSWQPDAPLKSNRWGILEPVDGDIVDADEIDIVVVPALGAGRNGHRIGSGFGYYDQFLSRTDATRVCLTYDACLVDVVPFEAHDAQMHIIVTESGVLNL